MYLAHRGDGPESKLTPHAGATAMLAFFTEVAAEGVDLENDGDMLLFQWGIYDWGSGEHFSLDITRQFSVPCGEDHEISQLSLTFKYPPEISLRALGEGNRWCYEQGEAESFASFVQGTPAYKAVAERKDGSVDLGYSNV